MGNISVIGPAINILIEEIEKKHDLKTHKLIIRRVGGSLEAAIFPHPGTFAAPVAAAYHETLAGALYNLAGEPGELQLLPSAIANPAYAAGEQANNDTLDQLNNPFDPRSGSYFEWLRGWWDAERGRALK